MPEIMDGKDIADFINRNILEKLDTLEREEKLQANGFYDGKSDMVRTFTYLYIPCADAFLQFDSGGGCKVAGRGYHVRRCIC